MCFMKNTPKVSVEPKKVVRHEANAELTKNSDKTNFRRQIYEENLQKTDYGFQTNQEGKKKTLLGE